jgi:hypothetical protein
MATYRSALGKMVDMDSLASKNPTIRAVGNMGVNSRGDTIDSHGNVIKSAAVKINEQYAQTISARGAQIQNNSATVNRAVPRPNEIIETPVEINAVNPAELSAAELEFESEDADNIAIEIEKNTKAKQRKST